MRSRKHKPTAAPDAPVEPQDAPPDVAVDDTAEQTRAKAREARGAAEQARAEADVLTRTARAQAERLVADAEQHARALTADALVAERRAADLDERAGYLAHADALRGQVEDAEKQADDLATEAANLAEQINALTGRLAELGEQREDATTALATAREAGDVDAVGRHRARVGAVDEVAAVLNGQREAAQQRLQAIGEVPGIGELAEAVERAQDLRGQLRRVLNVLDPERPEAQLDYAVDVLRANVARVLEDDPKPAQPPVVVRTGHTAQSR